MNGVDHGCDTRATAPTGESLPDAHASAATQEIEEWVPLSEIEGRYVAKVLGYTRGNKQAAARMLRVDRKTLDRMIKRHNIETHSTRERAKATGMRANP